MNIPDLWGWFGNFAYLIQAFLINMPSLAVVSLFLMCLNIIGIRNWKKIIKLDNKFILSKNEINLLFEIKEFIKYIQYFANEDKIKIFSEYSQLCDKYKKMREELDNG